METSEEVNAKKSTLDRAQALQLARQASMVYAARGKKVVAINMKKDKPDDETLAKLIVGPTGNLRAPTLRVGKTLLVGFNQEMYDELLA
ncbi:MAG: hypothetical protein KDA42_10315 [Planctomycetales bacterium]|nr:hypothetical protein [Planctomycetales bacterium]